MPTILHISASIRGQESVSRRLSTALIRRLQAKTGARIIERDLSANTLPFIDEARFTANSVPAAERTSEQRELAAIGDQLIAELQQADTIVLGLPVYNFTFPATLKAWADLVARAGTTFRYTANGPEGLLTGKKAFVTFASGGTPIGSEIDFLTPWLRHFLAFLGIDDLEFVAADAIMGEGGEAAISAAAREVERLAA